jgi:hypothetical protein
MHWSIHDSDFTVPFHSMRGRRFFPLTRIHNLMKAYDRASQSPVARVPACPTGHDASNGRFVGSCARVFLRRAADVGAQHSPSLGREGLPRGRARACWKSIDVDKRARTFGAVRAVGPHRWQERSAVPSVVSPRGSTWQPRAPATSLSGEGSSGQSWRRSETARRHCGGGRSFGGSPAPGFQDAVHGDHAGAFAQRTDRPLHRLRVDAQVRPHTPLA